MMLMEAEGIQLARRLEDASTAIQQIWRHRIELQFDGIDPWVHASDVDVLRVHHSRVAPKI